MAIDRSALVTISTWSEPSAGVATSSLVALPVLSTLAAGAVEAATW